MLLYIGTAVWLELFSKSDCSPKLSASFVFIGGAIFIALNRRILVFDESLLVLTEFLIILCLLSAWWMAVLVVRSSIISIEIDTGQSD